jgi:hypothetical protein
VVRCKACSRLVEYRQKIAHQRKREFKDWTYWGRSVPSFGDPRAEFVIIGLAPAAHGANRTGRMFTGDSSGSVVAYYPPSKSYVHQPPLERGFDKEYDLLEDKILARFQKKREDVKSVTWSDNIGGSLYTELGVASLNHPLIGSGSACIDFRDGSYIRICDVFYQDFNQKMTHYDGLHHWNHERRFEMQGGVEWDRHPGETHGIDKSLWIEVYVSNACENQFKKRAYWLERDDMQ